MRTTEGSYVYLASDEEYDAIIALVKRIIAGKGKDPRPGGGRRFERNVEGYLAELAACNHYGGVFNWDLDCSWGARDAGFDLIGKNGFTYGVKSVHQPHRRLAPKAHEFDSDRIIPDYYVLVVVKGKICWIKGEIAAEKVYKDRPLGKLRDDGYDCYIVENHELAPPIAPHWEWSRV